MCWSHLKVMIWLLLLRKYSRSFCSNLLSKIYKCALQHRVRTNIHTFEYCLEFYQRYSDLYETIVGSNFLYRLCRHVGFWCLEKENVLIPFSWNWESLLTDSPQLSAPTPKLWLECVMTKMTGALGGCCWETGRYAQFDAIPTAIRC
jgi:hypothetical protein